MYFSWLISTSCLRYFEYVYVQCMWQASFLETRFVWVFPHSFRFRQTPIIGSSDAGRRDYLDGLYTYRVYLQLHANSWYMGCLLFIGRVQTLKHILKMILHVGFPPFRHIWAILHILSSSTMLRRQCPRLPVPAFSQIFARMGCSLWPGSIIAKFSDLLLWF